MSITAVKRPALYCWRVALILRWTRVQASYIEDMQVPQNVRFLRHFNICYDW